MGVPTFTELSFLPDKIDIQIPKASHGFHMQLYFDTAFHCEEKLYGFPVGSIKLIPIFIQNIGTERLFKVSKLLLLVLVRIVHRLRKQGVQHT